MCVCHNALFKKVAASLPHGRNPLAESSADIDHGVPGEVGHDLCKLSHQGGGSVVGGFVYIPFANSLHVVILQGVAIRAVGVPDLLRPKHW
jgi:hypothetical protein